MTHTKEDWEVDGLDIEDYTPINIEAGNKKIAHIFSVDGEFEPHSEESKANAKLIVQSPVMLEAMQEFVNRVDIGEVRSTYTYNKFKEIIKATK